MPPPSKELTKNTTDQYAALGRFVEAFELMVHEVREMSICMAARDARHMALVEIAFHHQALSAKPLFDIFRAMVAEVLRDALKEKEDRAKGHNEGRPLVVDGDGNPLSITIKDQETLLGVLGFMQRKYDELANKRNDILHGTWFVGYPSSDDPYSSKFFIRRLKTTKRGLSPVADLPKNANELAALSEKCATIREWVTIFMMCLDGTATVADSFVFADQTWWRVSNAGTKSTLQ
jgi:hypothetical protein